MLAESMYHLVNSSYLSKVYELNNDEIGVINVFNKEILCFNSGGRVIDRQTKILVSSENHFPKVFSARIIDLQHNKISINTTTLNVSIDIGVKVDKPIKDTMKFKLMVN